MLISSAFSRRSVISGALGAAAACQSTEAQRAAAKPNIVFILADDLGAFDLSCFGRPDYKTPRIDSLAKDGIRLTAAYSNSATCSPTRTALITGRYQNRLMIGNYDPLPANRPDMMLPADKPTLASQLRSAGYATALVGKWHLGEIATAGPMRYGYDEFFGFPSGYIDYHSHDIVRGSPMFPGLRQPSLFEGDKPASAEGYATDIFTERAVDFITRKRKHPFFLSLHYNAPHWPWQTREDKAAGRYADFNYDGGSAAIFAEMVATLDESVGRVLKALEANDVANNTIVVFTSDNGGERFSYLWPLRGAKGTLHEGGIRVPALVRWPGKIRRGAVTSQVAITMDWLPTLLGMAGVSPDPSYPSDGVDLSPVLLGRPVTSERALYWRTGKWAAARRGSWKYVNDGYDYLFNLDNDQMERTNLKRRHAVEFSQLKAGWEAWNATMTPIPSDAAGNVESGRRSEALETPPT